MQKPDGQIIPIGDSMDEVIQKSKKAMLEKDLATDSTILDALSSTKEPPATESQDQEVVTLQDIFNNAYHFARKGCHQCVGKGWFIKEREPAVDDMKVPEDQRTITEMKILCKCLWANPTGAKIMKALEETVKREKGEEDVEKP